MKKIAISFFLVMSFVLTGCWFNNDELPFARIKGKEYTMRQFHSFATMAYNQPVLQRESRFPGDKQVVTLFIETQIYWPVAKKYKRHVMSGLDWEWKEYFFPGMMYMKNYIQKNMGFSDEEVEDYYKKHKNELVVEFKLEADVRLGHARPYILEKLFIDKFPPTEEFKKKYAGINEAEINRAWFVEKQSKAVLFYRDYYFQEKYGKPFPANVEDLVGTYVSKDEVMTVAQWMPEEKREAIKLDTKQQGDVASFMVTWKLLAEEAKKSGYAKSPEYKMMKKHFDRFEVVRYYANEILPTKIAQSRKPDSEDVTYYMWDKAGQAFADLDEKLMASRMDEVKKRLVQIALDSTTYTLRLKSDVRFLQKEYIDYLGESPQDLTKEADSLLSMNRKDKAKLVYENLSQNYTFTKEGQAAFQELARLYSDDNEIEKAIATYRDEILYTNQEAGKCQSYFMIGYLYSENLANYELAGANFRWVLKNQPDCDFADDAEFMYQHLGEPVVDIDELQAQAARQGRKE